MVSVLKTPDVSEQVDERRQTIAPADLSAYRRLDWRFFLPRPDIGDVAYCGPEGTALAKGLQAFSRSFRRLQFDKSNDISCESECVDLLVLLSPCKRDIAAATPALRSGGCLYAEMHGALGVLGSPPAKLSSCIRGAGFSIRALRDFGYEGIQAFWYRPNFEAPHQVVPLSRHEPLEYVLSRPRGDILGRLACAVVRGIVRVDMLPCLLPCVGMIARKL